MIQIITDSTSDLPPEIIARHDIKIVPLQVIFGQAVYRDGVDIQSQAFFARLRANKVSPTTSQPSVGAFQEVFQQHLAAGKEILGIFISEKLSGTLASAQGAKDLFPGAPITLVDSESVSMGLAFLTMAAARAVEAGATREEAAARVIALRKKVTILFTLETLEYLQRGGRIGGAQALVGSLLNIKPILEVRDGRVDAFERVRTKRKALDRIVEVTLERLGPKPAIVGVLHGDVEEEARTLLAQVQARLPHAETYVSILTPCLGVHTGPGTIGLAGLPSLE